MVVRATHSIVETVEVGVKPIAGVDMTSAEAASAAMVFAVAGASDGRQDFDEN
jgi:hypothetical protein